MKKNYFKKSLSLIMTVLMLMSCWVFVAPTEAEAAALETASALYNKTQLNGINTNIDTTMPTTMGKFKDPNMEGDENASWHVSQYGSQHYKNIFYSPVVTSSTPAAKMTGISNVDSVMVYYPETVMIYDGSTKPQMGVVACLDGGKYRVRSQAVYMSANANGLVVTDYWKGYTTGNLAHIINMHGTSAKYQFNHVSTSDSSHNTGYVINTDKNGEWYFYASDLRFDGTLASDEFVRKITPTWAFYGTYYRKKTFGSETGTMSTYTDVADKNIYVMNVKAYRDLLTTINTDKTNITNKAGQYTPESVKTYVNAANAILNLNPKNVGQSGSAVATWGTNMSTAYTNYVNARNGLKNREYEVTYDNMFSLADWRYSQSLGDANYVSVNLNEGKVTITNPNTSEFTTPMSGSSSNANTRNTSFYAMPVVGGQEYTIKYTTDYSDTQMFAFFYDKNGGCTHSGTYGNYNFAVRSGTGQATFKAPDNSTQMEIRFDNNIKGTANFWDIMIYPAAVKTELGVDSWTARPIRTLYTYNASVGTLPTPVRPGYKFDGWKEDTNGDGIGDAAAPTGNITSSRVLYSSWTVDNFTLTFDAAGGNASATSLVYSPEGSVQMPTVTRDGYAFDGWKVTTAGGNWNAGETYAAGETLTGKTGNATLTAQWKNVWTVTYYYGDNTTVLATVEVKDGATVGSLPTVTPTKETTAEYSYTFKSWTANDAEFTASTKVTSDLKVYPVFKNVPHTFEWAANPYKNATCDAPALVGKSCSGCGYSLGNVPYDGDNANWLKKGHDFSGDAIKIEGNDDQHAVKCVRYGKDGCTATELFDHTWSGDTSVGATCVIPGTVKKTCPCGAEKFVDGALDKTNHVNTKLVNVVTPDCENDGFTGDTVCADCGVTIAFGKTDPKLGHLFTKYLSDGNATCTADGTETAHCERCAATDTRTVEGSKLDHTFTNYVYNNDAKCGVDGTKTAECDTCDTGATDTITAEGTALEHNFNGEIKNNNDGTHSYKCTNKDCDVYGGATDCTYGSWDTTDLSQHIKTCEDCGYKLKENHNFTSWATTDEYKQADGQHSRSCTVCYKEVIKDCTYTRTEHAETCTADGYIVHSCNYCGHKYQTVATGKIGHNYSGEIKSYNNGQHNYLCVNGCGTYGYSGVENARVNCSFDYENTADGSHKATCAYCKYSTTEACSGGQATCTAKAVCTKCNTVYGETVPHSFTGTVVKLDGDKHAYLCEFCSTEGLYGVGAEKDATEACSGGTATCKDLAVCDKCNDTYGEYAAHVFNGFVIQLDNDVHAFRCSVCKDNSLYGVGSEVNATEACSGGTATCIKPALCEVCSGYHGEVDENAHVWRDWAHVEGTETHKRVCDLSPRDHIETVACEAATQEVVEPDCEAQGYTLNTCGTCGHEWKSDYVDALDHQWGAWEKGSAGWHQRTCEREDCTYGENGTAKVEESLCTYLQEVKEVVEPTCTEEGYTTYRCTGCGYEWNSFPVPATGHSYTKQTKKTESKYLRSTKDCVTDLTYWYCCDNCDVSAETEKDKYENEADLYWVREAAAGHKFDAKTATDDYLATEATCTEKATYYYSCSVCKASSKGTANEKTFEHGTALNHDWTDTETYLKSESDCVNNEVYYKECSRCHISSENETGATWEKANTKSGHDFTDGYTAGVAATCTDDGVVEHYTCQICKKHFKADKTTEIAADKLTIAALKHDYKDVAAKAATCEEDGYTKHKQCQREGCGYRNTDYKVIPAKGHEFNAENGYYCDTVCGYHAYKCSNCDAYGVDKVKYSAEYDGLDWIVVGGIKCEFTGEYVNYEADGIHSHKLTCVCGNEQSNVCADAEPEHIAPTCTEDGYYKHTCDVCSYEWIVASDAEDDKALGHKLVVKSNGNGTHSEYCERECGHAEKAEKCSTTTPATNCGDYDICDICKAAFGEAKPHVFTNYVSNNDATCTEDGTKTAICDTCTGEEKATHTIADKGTALGHDMSEYVYSTDGWKYIPEDFNEVIVAPTCHSEGNAISFCSRCDYYKTKTVKADPTSHVWEKDATSEDGLKWTTVGGNCATGVTMVNRCTTEGCNAKQTKTLEVEHDWQIVYIQAAGCTVHGYINFKCDVCGFTGRLEGGKTEFGGVDYSDKNIVAAGAHDWEKIDGVTNDYAALDGKIVYVDGDGNVVHVEKYPEYNAAGRGKMYCKKCNHIEEVAIDAMGNKTHDENGNLVHKHPEYATINADGTISYKSTLKTVAEVKSTCTVGGHKAYEECTRCSFSEYMVDRDSYYTEPLGHNDNNGDGKCDTCKTTIREDESKNCGCICHKESGFMKFIYKILKFFWKLFKMNPVCACGHEHY